MAKIGIIIRKLLPILLTCQLVNLSTMVGAIADAAHSDAAWQEHKSRHFIVYYRDDAAYAEKVSVKAEKDYQSISGKLGFGKFDDFWLWDKRVKIFLYGSAGEFRKITGSPEWADGKADYIKNEISSFSGNPVFVDSVLPHELTHLIFRDFMDYKTDVPIWINEGISQWIEPDKKQRAHAGAALLMKQNRLRGIVQIAGFDPHKKSAELTPHEFYAQSASVVSFMIDTYGVEKFRTLCANMRDGRTLEEALRFTYPDSINNVEKVQELWRKSLEVKHEKTDAE